jgi:hypothetical protein
VPSQIYLGNNLGKLERLWQLSHPSSALFGDYISLLLTVNLVEVQDGERT